MVDQSRLEDLRRRVQKDPASIAFAQLAEECRRSGAFQEAIDTCRAGLEIHPGYLSARVTLGRALVELGQLDEAQAELSRVLDSAPENLAAIRGLAEIYHSRGDLSAALAQYRAALLLARNDPDLEETIADLSRQVEPPKPAPTGGLTMEHMQDELLKRAPPPKATAAQVAPPPKATAPQVAPPPKADQGVWLQADNPAKAGSHEPGRGVQSSSHETESRAAAPEPPRASVAPAPEQSPQSPQSPQTPLRTVSSAISADSAVNVVPPPSATPVATNDRAMRTVAALEEWLAAIHVSREQRHP